MPMLKAKTITIIGIVIAAFGVVTPIAWDILADPYEMSLFVHSRTLLIQRNQEIEGLRVIFLSREIDKLFSTEISIQNTGRRLIQKDDIIKPMVVAFGEAKILGVALKENNQATSNIRSSRYPKRSCSLILIFLIVEKELSLMCSLKSHRK